MVFGFFGSVYGENRLRYRKPNFLDTKTETEPNYQKNRNFGSVRFSVYGKNVPTPNTKVLVRTKTWLGWEEKGRRTLHLIAPLRWVLNLGAILQVSRELKKVVIAIIKRTRDTMIFIVVRPMRTPCCGDLLWSRVALNPSQVI